MMDRTHWRTWIVLILIGIGAGCGNPAEPVRNNKDGAKKTAETPNDPKERTPEIVLQAITIDQLHDALKSHKGKIVVMDVWATWCIPCMKEFPHLVELHKKYGKDGVVCVSLAMDDEEKHDAALKFLKSVGATFPNFRFKSTGFDELKIESIPAVFVYDRAGEVAARFPRESTEDLKYSDVEERVRELLKK